jgi:predicted ribosomally synthesized peptide with SipW-like signal peptide
MKKILLSLFLIGVVSVVALFATQAYFSDTETSTGNTFTAGAIDLKVDSQQHYNNAVCVDGLWELEVGETATNPQYPVIGTDCGGTWGQTPEGKDIVGERFFDFADVKPGDSGENTVSLHVINNDAWVCAEVTNLANEDNGLTEPESAVDTTDGTGNGELQNKLEMTIWKDDGDNILEPGETILATGNPINGYLPVYDSTSEASLPGGDTAYLGVKWELPLATGNEVQTDSLTGDIIFNAIQSRNLETFKCSDLYQEVCGDEKDNDYDGQIDEGCPYCGDGSINQTSEVCDDGNMMGDDGCSASCTIEEGYQCTGEPSTCVQTDNDKDGDPDTTDCQPNDATVYHGATEVFNDKDDDCDGLVNEGIVGWVSPTGYVDATNMWDGEELLYDHALWGVYATSHTPFQYLELTLPATTDVNKVRYWIPWGTWVSSVPSVNVDIYYSGAWHNVYSGAYATDTWNETAFTEQSVTKARFKFNGGTWVGYLGEFEFYANN